MESRLFIRAATALVARIRDSALLAAIGKEDPSEKAEIQKQINNLFAGLQDPSLCVSPPLLRDVALEHGYDVDPRVLHRIRIEEERCWQ